MQIDIEKFNPERPCNVDWFQKELDRACRDRNIELRIVWGPDLNKFNPRRDLTLKKYPHPQGGWKKFKKGEYIVRNQRVIGYRSLAGIITGEADGLFVPDIHSEQQAFDRWIIEQKLHDAFAREQHAKARFRMIDGLKVDILGEFPKEGIWVWFDDIAAHDRQDHNPNGFCTTCACCKALDERNQMCLGQYREPDERDLTNARAALKARDQFPLLRNPDEPPTAEEIRRNAQSLIDQIEAEEAKKDAALEQEIAEEIASILSMQTEPKFDMGSAHQKSNQ